MKKSISIILGILVLSAGCDSISDSVIDSGANEIKVLSVNVPSKIIYTDSSTSLTIKLEVEDKSAVKSVWCKIVFSDGSITVNKNVAMLDNGDTESNGDVLENDNIFSGKVLISDEYPSGYYNIEFYINEITGASVKAAVARFEFDNAQDNIAPVLSELNIPSQIQRNERFTFSVKAVDENGSHDIKSVFYELFTPNGTQVSNSENLTEFPMFDNGLEQQNGDLFDGDSVYSVYLTFPGDVETGSWQFKFSAKDRGGKTSNQLTHNLDVQ